MAQTNALPKAVASAQHSASPSGSTTDPTFEASSGRLFVLIAVACAMPFVAALVAGAAQ